MGKGATGSGARRTKHRPKEIRPVLLARNFYKQQVLHWRYVRQQLLRFALAHLWQHQAPHTGGQGDIDRRNGGTDEGILDCRTGEKIR